MSWAPPRRPGGLDGPRRKHFTASSENTAPILPKSFPVSSAVCLLFPARERGGWQHAGGCCRTRCVPGAGADPAEEQSRWQGLAAQGHSPSLPPVPWDGTFPLTVPGAQRRPRGELEKPRKPLWSPCTPLMRMHNPSSFSPAFHPLPCLCREHLSTPSFPSSSLTAHLPPLPQPPSFPRFPQSLHHPPLALPIHTRSLSPSTYCLFLCFSCPRTPFPSMPSHLSHGLMFSIQPHPPGLLPLNTFPSVHIPCLQPRAHALPAFVSNERSPGCSCPTGMWVEVAKCPSCRRTGGKSRNLEGEGCAEAIRETEQVKNRRRVSRRLSAAVIALPRRH